MSKRLSDVEEQLRGDARSAVTGAAVTAGVPIVAAIGFAIWTTVTGQAGPWIVLAALVGGVLVLAVILLLQRVGVSTRVRNTLRAIALIALLCVVIWGVSWVVGELQDLQRLRNGQSANAQGPIYAENPDHAEQLNELNKLRGIEKQLGELNRELAAKQAEIETLKAQLAEKQRQLDNRARIGEVRKQLGNLVVQGRALRKQCNAIPPVEYKMKIALWVADGVRLLSESGFEAEAQRLKNMTPPAGLPRLASPSCAPQSQNNDSALGIFVLEFLIDDISNRLGN